LKSKLELSTTLKNLSSSSSTWDSAVAATEGESLVSSVDIKDMVPFNHLKNSRADDGFDALGQQRIRGGQPERRFWLLLL
jgi:hypothetical protein